MKKILAILILLSLDSYPDNLSKLKMACDIGNEKACQELKAHESLNKKSNTHKLDDYDVLSCPANVLERYPSLKKKHKNVAWKDVVIGYKDHWEKYGVTSPLDAVRWGDMFVRPSNYYYGELKKIGVTKPIQAKKWLCANTWEGSDGSFAGSIRSWMNKGIKTPEELISYRASKNKNSSSSNEVKLPKAKKNMQVTKKENSVNEIQHLGSINLSGTKTTPSNNSNTWYKVANQYGREEWEKTGLSVESVLRWIKVGVPDVGTLERYKKFGLDTPDKVHKWYKVDNLPSINFYRNSGIKTAKEGREWFTLGISIRDIKGWKKAGIITAVEASEWSKLSVRYSDIDKLKRINIHTVPEAKQWVQVGVKAAWIEYWKEKGVNDPNEAHQWIQADIYFRDVKEWKYAGISPEEAKEWKDSGITRLSEIKNWKEIGLSVEDVSKWKKIGLNIHGVKNWIKSGIPTAKKAKEWISIGLKDNSVINKWVEAGLDTPKKVNKWLSAGFNDGYLWHSQGFSINEAIVAKKEAIVSKKEDPYKIINRYGCETLSANIVSRIASNKYEISFTPVYSTAIEHISFSGRKTRGDYYSTPNAILMTHSRSFTSRGSMNILVNKDTKIKNAKTVNGFRKKVKIYKECTFRNAIKQELIDNGYGNLDIKLMLQ